MTSEFRCPQLATIHQRPIKPAQRSTFGVRYSIFFSCLTRFDHLNFAIRYSSIPSSLKGLSYFDILISSFAASASKKPDTSCRNSTKRAWTFLLLAKKIKFFYSFFHKHLQILHPKKIPDFRIKHASLCFIGRPKAQARRACPERSRTGPVKLANNQ